MTDKEVVTQLQSEESLDKRLDDYDFKQVIRYAPFKIIDIQTILAVYPGEADGDSWHYIVLLKDGRYGHVQAWCDYTGWGCQEGGSGGIYDSIADAIGAVEENNTHKKVVQDNLTAQIAGAPYALK